MKTILLLAGATLLSAGVDLWTPLGPEGGGAGFIAVDPLNPGTLYASTNGGLFKSTDAALTWTPTGFGVRPECLAVDPQVSGVHYACAPAGGLFKSTDGGSSWKEIDSGIGGCAHVAALAIDPQNSSTVYAACYYQKPATICANTNFSLIVESADGGQNWDDLSPGSLLAIDPLNSSTLYANLGGKLSQSTDAGGHWQLANNGLSDENQCGMLGPVRVDPRSTNIVYRRQGGLPGCRPGASGSVFTSIDAAASWAMLNSQPDGQGVVGLAIDPRDSGVLYAWNGRGLFQSTDSGGSWTHFRPGDYVGALAVDPQNPSALYAAQGIYGFYTETAKVFQSSDRGKTWSEADSGIPVMTLFGGTPSSMLAIHTLMVDPYATGQVYAGTLAGVFRTKDGGASWTSVNDGLTNPNVHALAFDPNDSNTLCWHG